MKETIAISLVGLVIMLALGSLLYNSDGVSRAVGVATAEGEVLMQHIGWGFGAYIPTLLGFYAIVIGGQLLVADPAAAAKTRRTLGFTAEAMTGALAPAFVLIVVACIADPSQAGALFVIFPVSAVMLFLTVQLGGFIVFERELRRAFAKSSRDWAKGRLKDLRRRSRKPIWLVVAIHTMIAGLIGAGTMLVVTLLTEPTAVMNLLNGLMVAMILALVLGLVSVLGVHTFQTARDRMSKIVAWLIPSGFYLLSLLLALEIGTTFHAVAGVSVLIIVVFSATSALWLRKWASQLWLNWTLQGAATACAAKSVASTYARSMREIQELNPAPSDIDESRMWKARALAAFRAFCKPPSDVSLNEVDCENVPDRSQTATRH